jgi:DNA-binding response OmpR family regulator
VNRTNTILLVGNDVDLADTLSHQLVMHSYVVDLVSTAAGGLRRADEIRPDLVILDNALPDMDGQTLCRELRARKFFAPVFMLIDEGADAAIVQAFETGANDCITKPIKYPLLLARLRAHLRAYDWRENQAIHIGGFQFRPQAKVVVDDESQRKIPLTEKETNVLRFLCRRAGKTVSREDLIAAVWGRNLASAHTLEAHIYRLRQKIEKVPGDPSLIVTGNGGYILSLQTNRVRGRVPRALKSKSR